MRISSATAFRGRFTLPGDKSLSHRMALFGAMADGETTIGNYSTAADCESTLRCLESLGLRVRRERRSVAIDGRGPDGLQQAPGPLDAGNSGSTLRMLAGVLAGRPFRSVLTGDESLCRRPVERVAAPLRAMGARVETTAGRPPLTIVGGGLRGVSWDLAVPSAQVKTAVLLAGLQAEGTTTVRERLPSRDHTERLLPLFGAAVEVSGDALSVRRHEALRPVTFEVPGDASSAAFLVVAAVILPHSEVRIERVLLNPRRVAFLDVLKAMGADVRTGVEASAPEPVGWIEARSSRLQGVAVGPEMVPALIDEVPALAVAAAHAGGAFTISGAGELRVKESDRIAALVAGLGRMGAAIEEHEDGFTIQGGRPLRGAKVAAQGDHRIAMALAVAALAAHGETEIEDAACASVSFPEFYDLLALGREQGRRGRG
ncbi:MAG TPA: 3-phosphoshikimate 1-carboxyvinyltransferase [Vicinamibacteria bacterium]|nr:3-phosphoshikimate 1-carboxyvinyltransferase [Vicinamibacteria bacterium]